MTASIQWPSELVLSILDLRSEVGVAKESYITDVCPQLKEKSCRMISHDSPISHPLQARLGTDSKRLDIIGLSECYGHSRGGRADPALTWRIQLGVLNFESRTMFRLQFPKLGPLKKRRFKQTDLKSPSRVPLMNSIFVLRGHRKDNFVSSLLLAACRNCASWVKAPVLAFPESLFSNRQRGAN